MGAMTMTQREWRGISPDRIPESRSDYPREQSALLALAIVLFLAAALLAVARIVWRVVEWCV